MTPEDITNRPRDIRRAAELGGLSIRANRRRKRRSLARFVLALLPIAAFAALTWALYGAELLALIGGRV